MRIVCHVPVDILGRKTHSYAMPKRSSKKRPVDINQLASSIMDEATAEILRNSPEKNPAAVMLGRKGGLKGGKARAKKLSKSRRKEIAREAAMMRWHKDSV